MSGQACPKCAHGAHVGLCPVSACPCGAPPPDQLLAEAGIAHPCDRCGASPAHLFDHTPLAEDGTWERLCNACIDKLLEPWQGPVATEVQP